MSDERIGKLLNRARKDEQEKRKRKAHRPSSLELVAVENYRDETIRTIVLHLRNHGPKSQVQLAAELFENLHFSVGELGWWLDQIPIIDITQEGIWYVKERETREGTVKEAVSSGISS
jgi:hypothetical protein